MKLTESALKLINNKSVRPLLALALNKSEQRIIRYIRTNDDNLTKASALQVIKEKTGLSEEEILEQEPSPASV